MHATEFAFQTQVLERSFFKMVASKPNEEQGGVLFFAIGQINNLHWKRHNAIFGTGSIFLISHFLVCPNTSDIRNRRYTVSSLDQLEGIAEETATALHCNYIHWHSHPRGGVAIPSANDLNFWRRHFHPWKYRNHIGVPEGVVVTDRDFSACAVTGDGASDYVTKELLTWKEIRRLTRAYETRKASA